MCFRANICLVLVYLSILFNLQLFAYHKLLAVSVWLCMNGTRCILAWKPYRCRCIRADVRRWCRSVEQSALRQCTRQIDIQFSFVVFSMLFFCGCFITFVSLTCNCCCYTAIDVVYFYCVWWASGRARVRVYVPRQLATQLLYISDVQWRHIFSIWFPVVHISSCFLSLFLSFCILFRRYLLFRMH